MKKSMVSLLGVAFVVALLATGIFYGLFVGKLESSPKFQGEPVVVATHRLERGAVIKREDLRVTSWHGAAPKGAFKAPDQVVGWTVLDAFEEREPLMQSRIASSGSGGGAMGIPSGKRAVSIHAFDSSGVMALLRPGLRVDVQVIGGSGEPTLRTLVNKMEVLSVSSQAENVASRQGQAPVVTLLATPREAELLGLADSTARLRLALRNPLDDSAPAQRPVVASELFRTTPSRAPVQAAANAPPGPRIRLHVNMVAAGPSGRSALGRHLASPWREDDFTVAALSKDAMNAVESLRERKLVERLSDAELSAANRQEVVLRAGERWPAAGGRWYSSCGMRIRLAPVLADNGHVRLRVMPEVTAPDGLGVTTRRVETEMDLADGQSVVVSPSFASLGMPDMLGRLFPKQPVAPDAELLVVVTPRLATP